MQNLVSYFICVLDIAGFFWKLLNVIYSTFLSLVHLSMLGEFSIRSFKFHLCV